MYAVTEHINKGSLRELFFVNQIKNSQSLHPNLIENTIELSNKGDFIINAMHTFEIGGKGKGFNQISEIESGFVVADDIETGFKNKIPLWLLASYTKTYINFLL